MLMIMMQLYLQIGFKNSLFSPSMPLDLVRFHLKRTIIDPIFVGPFNFGNEVSSSC